MKKTKTSELKFKRGSFIYKDYVLSPCRNAFNGKTSYWLSKKGCVIAVYCFTPLFKDKRMSLEGITEMIESTIPLLESKLKAGGSA